MKNRFILFTVLTITLFLCVFSLSLRAKGKKEFIVGVALTPFVVNTSFAGKGSADMREIFQTGADEFEKLYGYTQTLKIYPSPKFLNKSFKEKTTHFASGILAAYLMAKSENLPVKPLFTISNTGSNIYTYCIFAHKDSGMKTLKDLKGKRFVTEYPLFVSKKEPLPPRESYIYWTMMKKILMKNNINVPFKTFFKEFNVIPVPSESVAYGVLLGKSDAFFNNTGYVKSLINYDKEFNKLIALSCMDASSGAPLYYLEGTSLDVAGKFKSYVLSPPSGSQLEKIFKKKFAGFGAYSVEEKYYDIYFKWLKEAEQKGWLKEFDEIMKNMPKPRKK